MGPFLRQNRTPTGTGLIALDPLFLNFSNYKRDAMVDIQRAHAALTLNPGKKRLFVFDARQYNIFDKKMTTDTTIGQLKMTNR